MPGDVVEDIQADAASRRNLAGNNLFENLGDPIQKLLLEVSSQGKEVDDRTMELLQHITVKQLAKIFEMLGQGEDPETILAWLKRRARKNQKGEDNWAEERKAMIKTGAERDPVAFFKEIEAANAAMAQEFQDMEEERQQLRLAKAKEREKARGEKQKELEAAKKAIEDEGGWWKATDHMPEADKKAVNAAFEKFATKNSEFDNADKDQDGEWWKADPYRRDWERNKGKGKKWTAVVEGAKDKATDPELAVREEFYKGNDWWKADKYKRDWEATEDAEWWKEEPYIKDWQQNKHEGARWKAADEESGLEGEGNTYPATPEEQQRREDWYKANGPRGVVKAWNAATEGDPEKCSVPEKKAREEFYRNGDWWKNDDARQDFNDKGLDADALQSAGKPQDTEWWKQEPYREDFWKNGPDGKKWGAITEDAGVDGEGDKKPAPEPEKKRREDWYKDNWWKQPEYKDDWQKNGKSGKQWKAPSEKDAKSGNYKKPVGEEERKKREEWYKDGGDEWWKQPQYIEDYFQKGPDGRHWPAKTEADGQGGRGQENKAKPDEQKKREDWYRSNWWKQPKYTDDFHKNGALGDAWQSKNDVPNVDKEWWKQAPFIDNWTKTMKPKTMPSDQEWWKQPQYVEDFHRNGPKGKQWTANGETNGIEGNGHTKPAPEPEKKEREAWYKDNWWKAPKHIQDWSRSGRSWAEDATPEEQEARDEWYRTHAPKPIPDAEQATRVAWYRDHCSQPEPAELSARKAWYRCQLDDDTKARRLEWYRNCTDNSKRVFIDELPELLTDINEGQAPTEADVKALISCVSRLHSGEDPAEEPQYVSKGTFIRAVAETGLYVRDDDDGLDMRAEEVLHDLQRRDMQEREEIAAHWAMAAGEGSDGQPSETGDEPEEPVACAWDNRPHDAPPCCAASDAQPSEAGDKPDEGARCQLSCCSRDVPDVKPSEAGDEPEEPVAWENRPHDEAGAEPHEHASRTWKYGPHDASVCCGTSDTRLSEASDEPDAGGCCPGLTPDTESCGPAEDPSEEGSEEGGEACPGCCYTCANPDPEYHDCCTWINGPDATPRRIRFYSDEPEGGMPVESSCSSDEEDDCSEASPMVDDELDSLIECPGPYDDEPEWSEDEEDPEADIYPGGVGSDNGSWSDDDSDDASGEGLDEPWVLPLPEVTNNVYLKSYFPTLKWHASRKPTAADRRVWVVDHFAKSFYCLDAKGKMKDQHPANKLVQLERNIMDPRRARLLFFDAPRSFEVIFQSTEERERFYETASSIRPAIRVYAPSLTKPDTAHNGSIVTTIDGTKANSVTHLMPNPFQKTGALVDREFSGRCNINASSIQDEPVDVWCGTFNLSGAAPPCDPACLEAWMPRGTHDIYAVGAQGVSYQSEEGEWFSYVQDYLGKDYLVLSSLQMWDVSLIVLCRKKCLLKITNVEGSTHATLHKDKCGMKGAVGICLKYHNTSMAFVSCHLAARMERSNMRRINIEEIVGHLQLGNGECDISSQFHHVFWMGDMNYRIEMEAGEAEPLLKQGRWAELLEHDQLQADMREHGVLHGFVEAPILFPPTYRCKVGADAFVRDKGHAPSYTDRILVKSMANAVLRCTSYKSAPSVMTSEHRPVSATYTVRCIRPHASCFHRDQDPRPQFNFTSIAFTEQTHKMFRKPAVSLYSPFSEHADKAATLRTSTMVPEFVGDSLPGPVQAVVQMPEYLERGHILMVFRDNSESRQDKKFRGAATMELAGCVAPYDVERECDLDVLCLGRKVGVVKVKYNVTNYGYTPPPGCTQGRVPQEALMDRE
eukprot:TRINITY_DN83_c0_g1_i1.p1 TRINITY_DN83_c0_g1~~TRINITY_DN83_c0_g1_i1.p1  ORF type:complete len:1783 (+),score=668.90 TRINITY_DN83_c0_g1_i1:154-5502(+)